MTIITRDYVLTTKENLPIETQRRAIDSFEFSFGLAISAASVFSPSKALNYLPVRTLFPEHNEDFHPLLLAKQVRAGSSEENTRSESLLRRIYHLGRASVSVRCVPDFKQQLDELHFIFGGMYHRDIDPAVTAIEGIVSEVNKLNSSALEWYKQ